MAKQKKEKAEAKVKEMETEFDYCPSGMSKAYYRFKIVVFDENDDQIVDESNGKPIVTGTIYLNKKYYDGAFPKEIILALGDPWED